MLCSLIILETRRHWQKSLRYKDYGIFSYEWLWYNIFQTWIILYKADYKKITPNFQPLSGAV